MNGRRRLFIVLGVASSLAFLAIALYRLRLHDVGAALGSAHIWPWVPLAVALYLVGQLVRGVRCQLLVSREATLSLWTATNIVVLGYATNNLLPARLGEIARAGMLAERSGLPFVQSLTVTFLERVLDGLTLLVFLIIAAATLPHLTWLGPTLEIAGLVFGVALSGVALAVLAPEWLIGVSSRITARVGARLHDRVVGIVSQVVAGVAFLRSPAHATKIGVLSVLVWSLEGSMFAALLPALDIPVHYNTALLALSVTNLGILVPSTPGFIGPFHYFCQQALVAVGVSEATGFAYAVVVHASFYVPITLWGVLVLFGYGISLSKTIAIAGAARPLDQLGPLKPRPAAPGPGSAAPSRFMSALVEAMLPLDAEGIPAGEQAAVVRRVAQFVEGAVAELPLRLALLFRVGMLGFRALTLVRFVRGLHGVKLEARRRWVEGFAYGRLGLARQLFRPVRSTAFICYYAQPEVARALAPSRAAA